MMLNRHRLSLPRIVAACSVAASVFALPAAAQPTLINLTGSTCLENFVRAPASSHDFIDVDGDGLSAMFGVVDQLAPNFAPPYPPFPSDFIWALQARFVGSVNGLAELDDWGKMFATAAFHLSVPSGNAYVNRAQFVTNGILTPPFANPANPGASPLTSDFSLLKSLYAPPGQPSGGGIRIDIALTDAPARQYARIPGVPDLDDKPLTPGYGQPTKPILNPTGTLAGGAGYELLTFTTLNFNDFNPDACTVYDKCLCWEPLAVMTNLGTCRQTITFSELRSLSVTGRLPNGENLVFVTRDAVGATRIALANAVCLNPSWAVGENVGAPSSAPNQSVLGSNFVPSNKQSVTAQENAIINHRLGIGYSTAVRAVASPGWLTNARAEILGVRNDLGGGVAFARPNINNVLDNDINGYRLGSFCCFTTIGDPSNENEIGGISGNTNPRLRNPQAAAYINNICRSIDGFISAPPPVPITPAHGLFALGCIFPSALDFIPDPNCPCIFVPNPALNLALQGFIRPNSVLNNPALNFFGTVTLNGRVPVRQSGAGILYTDGVPNGTTYRNQLGANITYSSPLTPRNRCAGDFNGDGLRNCDDSVELIRAWWNRNGGPFWVPPNGTGPIAGVPGLDAIIEVLGDFTGDGNFNTADVRYWADGLALDPSTGLLNRCQGFAKIDLAWQVLTGDNNFFGTVLATGAPYTAGASAADVAGPANLFTPGYNPIGADGVVNAWDIDYIFKQFRQNPRVTDNQLNWNNLDEAACGDLSADINGDLVVDIFDICKLLSFLGTSLGDVNLDGVINAQDVAIIQANLGNPGGYAQGDVNGSGTVTEADLDILSGIGNPCPAPVVITSVTPTTAGPGDIICINGSGFGANPDKLCATIRVGGDAFALRVIEAQPNQIKAVVRPVPGFVQTGQIMVACGTGETGTFVPNVDGVIPEDPMGTWIWCRLNDPAFSPETVTLNPALPPENQQWFFHEPHTPGTPLCIYIDGSWMPNTYIRVITRMHGNQLGTPFGWDHETFCTRIRQGGNALQCAAKICDTIVCSFAREGLAVGCFVAPAPIPGNPNRAKITVTVPGGTIDWGMMTICTEMPQKVTIPSGGGTVVTGFFGATISPDPQGARVGNIGSSGEDGATIDLPVPGDSVDVRIVPIDLDIPDRRLTLSAWGDWNGIVGANLGRAIVQGRPQSCEDICADYTEVGSPNVTVQVFNNGALVDSVTLPNGKVGVVQPLVPGPLPLVDCWGKLAPLPPVPPCFWIRWAGDFRFTPDGPGRGGPIVGDELRLLAASASAPITLLRQFDQALGNPASAPPLELIIRGLAVPACPGDYDGDGMVGIGDVARTTLNWSMPVGPNTPPDADGDGFIGIAELAVVINNWATVCP